MISLPFSGPPSHVRWGEAVGALERPPVWGLTWFTARKCPVQGDADQLSTACKPGSVRKKRWMHAARNYKADEALAETLELRDLAAPTASTLPTDDATHSPTMALDIERLDSRGCRFDGGTSPPQGRDRPAKGRGVLTAMKDIPTWGLESSSTLTRKKLTSTCRGGHLSISASHTHGSCTTGERRPLFKLGLSFFLFGLINNGAYSIPICMSTVKLAPLQYFT